MKCKTRIKGIFTTYKLEYHIRSGMWVVHDLGYGKTHTFKSKYDMVLAFPNFKYIKLEWDDDYSGERLTKELTKGAGA